MEENKEMANYTGATASTTNAENRVIKREVNSQIHQHLSTIFVVVGIVSFTLGAIVNFYTIKRLAANPYK